MRRRPATWPDACHGNAGAARSRPLECVAPDWPGELFPLYALHPLQRHLPAKARAITGFAVQASVGLRRPAKEGTMSLHLDPRATALALIDVQQGILSMPLAPYDA